jgi:uncharacterized protein YndB with AHSA1/START domain
MPTHKDLKRLTRSRMKKTGESYTTARARLLAKKDRSRPAPGAPPPASAPASVRQPKPELRDYAALAGVSDETVRARTGCTWERWVHALDYKGAASMSHRDIAAYVEKTFKITSWWAQTVTVGYERIKGLREIGQRRSGSYEASKSKTVPVPLADLYRAWSDAKARARWLPGVKPTVRKATAGKSMRITWEDGTSVEVGFFAKGDGKSVVQLTHGKLPSKADAEARKAYWAERLGALALLLAAPGAAR